MTIYHNQARAAETQPCKAHTHTHTNTCTHVHSKPLSLAPGSRLGAAAGFRLRSLNKLADSRSSDGKSTLLQAVVTEVCARARRANGGAPDSGGGGRCGGAEAEAAAGSASGAGAAAKAGTPPARRPADASAAVAAAPGVGLLSDELPHVTSPRLRSSLADATELLRQVGRMLGPGVPHVLAAAMHR